MSDIEKNTEKQEKNTDQTTFNNAAYCESESEFSTSASDAAREQEAYDTVAATPSKWLHNEAYTYFQVAFFATWGCLIRLGIDELMGPEVAGLEDPNTIINQAFFSNMLGSFILGLLAASTLKKYSGFHSLHTGISTGLCGSITTYSKWNQQVSLILIGEASPVGQAQVTAFAAMYIDMCAFYASFQIGKDISFGILKYIHRYEENHENQAPYPHLPKCAFSKYVNPAATFVLFVVWAVLLGVGVGLRENTTLFYYCICATMAPFGAVCRFLLGKLNAKNFGFHSAVWPISRMRSVPIGTFLANIIGSTLIAATHVVTTWVTMTDLQLTVISCLQSGFLACFTTISTFMSEVSNYRGKGKLVAAWFYPFFTIVFCQMVGGLINGISWAFANNSA